MEERQEPRPRVVRGSDRPFAISNERNGTVRNDDVLVIISGSPMWVTGTTNLLKFHRVGERR